MKKHLFIPLLLIIVFAGCEDASHDYDKQESDYHSHDYSKDKIDTVYIHDTITISGFPAEQVKNMLIQYYHGGFYDAQNMCIELYNENNFSISKMKTIRYGHFQIIDAKLSNFEESFKALK